MFESIFLLIDRLHTDLLSCFEYLALKKYLEIQLNLVLGFIFENLSLTVNCNLITNIIDRNVRISLLYFMSKYC